MVPSTSPDPTSPQRDIGAFVDLCAEHDLWFVARPGPFVMAELKNEGLPYRLYREHPEIMPVGWDGVPAPTRTVDYLAPAYLTEVRRWYDAVMPVLARRLQPSGGNVIAVQLDNEVGMLAWVANSPDLTEGLVADLRDWLATRYGAALDDRYPVAGDPQAWIEAVRSPKETWAAALRVDLGEFMRERFARYLGVLRDYATAAGVRDVPFIVNVHGTEGGSAEPFPIGISQLMRSYAGVPGFISGSDHYVGDMTIATTTGLYLLNAFSAAVHDADQPLTSVEFEAGSGDYGGGLDNQHDPSGVELKTRLFVAQGNRMINYYLFAGGVNPMLDAPVGDGNDRISFTGERHGTSSPVGSLGERGLAYEPTARAVAAVRAQEPWLAGMREEHDELALGFIPDAYLTEYHYPGSDVMGEVVADLTAHRGAGARQALARSLLLAGFRFGARDLQGTRDEPLPRVIALATGRYLAAAVQQRLVTHVRDGGNLLLLGLVPDADLEGRPCTVLADALGVRGGEVHREAFNRFPSVVTGPWLALPETRVGWFQEVHAPGGEVLLRAATTGDTCGVEVSSGAGKAVLLTAELPCDPGLFAAAAGRLGVVPGLTNDARVPGLFATSTVDDTGGRLLHLLNVSGYANPTRLWHDGNPQFGGRILVLPPRTGRMLPVDLRLPAATVCWSTAEITGHAPRAIGFELLAAEDVIVVRTDRRVSADRPCDIRADGPVSTITVRRNRAARGTLTLTFT